MNGYSFKKTLGKAFKAFLVSLIIGILTDFGLPEESIDIIQSMLQSMGIAGIFGVLNYLKNR